MSPHHSPTMRLDTEQQWQYEGLTQMVSVNLVLLMPPLPPHTQPVPTALQ